MGGVSSGRGRGVCNYRGAVVGVQDLETFRRVQDGERHTQLRREARQ